MTRSRPAFGLVVLVLSATWLAAQPPRKEEEEDPPAKAKAKPAVPVPVTEPDRKDPPPAVPADDVGTLDEELARVTNAAARDLFKALTPPYDRLESTFAGGSNYNVALLKDRDLSEDKLEVFELDWTLQNGKPKTLRTGSGFTFIPFEQRVLQQVNRYLAKETIADRSDQLETAARAVAAGLRFHQEMVAAGKRVGPKWKDDEKALRDRLVKLHRERFTYLVEAKRYEEAKSFGALLTGKYKDNLEIKNDVYALFLRHHYLRVAVPDKDPPDADKRELRKLLLAYEQLPGKKDDGLTGQVRRKLTGWAAALVAEAKALNALKQSAPALQKLRQAETLDPDAPGASDVRAGLRGTVLYVGVSRLPEKMSPAAAETDAERWAVELMFEGLLQAVPEVGLNQLDFIGYRPVLAEGLPGVMPLGRTFVLPKNVRWAKDTGAVMDARDVKGTLALLRQPALRDKWGSVGLDVFQELDRLDDPFRFRLAYEQGILEPLGRATFKVLPAVYLGEKGKKEADDAEFAAKPFGTGPFKYEGQETEGSDRMCAVFRANPFYEQRAGRFGLPWIREIRFYVPDPSKLVTDTTAGQLHLYPDAPPDAVVRFRKDENLERMTTVAAAKTNRRIHLLAVNHRRQALQSDKIRQGLSAAINREAILKEVYRVAGMEKAHHALTGPFPVKSWATPKEEKEMPLYRPGAGGLFAEALKDRTLKLRLIYAKDDPLNAQAAARIKAQIQQASADKAGKPIVEVEETPLAPETFREKLRLEFDYDLALTTFDYRDDLFSLAALLDPDAASRGGRNLCGYLAAGTNPVEADRRLRRLIDEARQSRDFSKTVTDKTWDIHRLFNQRVPFIPLWQLDRFMVAHKDLALHFTDPEVGAPVERLDPAVVFTGVEMWRLK